MTRNNAYRRRLLRVLWLCQGLCVVLLALGVRLAGNYGYAFSKGMTIWFLAYSLATLLLRFALKQDSLESYSLVALDFFALLLFGYFEPHFLLPEFLMIPILLIEIAALYPTIPGIAAILLLGVPGSVLLSYANYASLALAIQDRKYSVSAFAALYYSPITLASLVLIMQIAHMERTDARLAGMETLNRQLDKINRDITNKMFKLKRDSVVEERKRITKEIHDMAGYIFINLIMMLQAASAVLHKDLDKAESLIIDAREYANRGIEEIRQILRGMRSTNTSPLSLQNELFDVGESFQKATNVALSLQFGNWPKTFSRELDLFFTSFLQEGLTNSLKHGNADAIEVICSATADDVIMSIGDNGKGALPPLRKGIGLSGIEDYVEALQGHVDIKTDENGFRIAVSIPKSALSALAAKN